MLSKTELTSIFNNRETALQRIEFEIQHGSAFDASWVDGEKRTLLAVLLTDYEPTVETVLYLTEGHYCGGVEGVINFLLIKDKWSERERGWVISQIRREYPQSAYDYSLVKTLSLFKDIYLLKYDSGSIFASFTGVPLTFEFVKYVKTTYDYKFTELDLIEMTKLGKVLNEDKYVDLLKGLDDRRKAFALIAAIDNMNDAAEYALLKLGTPTDLVVTYNGIKRCAFGFFMHRTNGTKGYNYINMYIEGVVENDVGDFVGNLAKKYASKLDPAFKGGLGYRPQKRVKLTNQ